ncbi:MAG: PKD domain-containing protein [Bacteroidota bacterium]
MLKKTSLLLLSFIGFTNILFAQISTVPSPATGCGNLSVQFFFPSGSSWAWQAGNPSNATSTISSPTFTYPTPGNYTARVTVDGVLHTIPVTVFPNPTVSLTSPANLSSFCKGSVVPFTASTSGGIGTYTFEFGDGTNETTTANSSSHTYTNAFPTLSTNVRIRDVNGCEKASNPIFISIINGPTAAGSVSPTFSCTPPLTVNFSNNSTTTSSTFSYLWEFGNGQTSTATSPTNVYTTTGTFPVSLTVTQPECSVKNSTIGTVTIGKIQAGFSNTTPTICEGNTVTFTNASIPLPSTSLSFSSWTFSGGAPSTSLSNGIQIVTYTNFGTYTTALSVTDNRGCSDAITKNSIIIVNPSPVASITSSATGSCNVPLVVNFQASAPTTGTYAWKFPGATATSTITQTATATFTNFGTYVVSLTFTNGFGCSTLATKTISISPPVADFIASPRQGCVPLIVSFANTSISTADPIVSYTWLFPNSGANPAYTPTPVVTFNDRGFYDVTLLIKTESGCVSTITKSNYIQTGAISNDDFVASLTDICYNTYVSTITFTSNAGTSFIADSVSWTFEKGTPPTFNSSATAGDTVIVNYNIDVGRFDVTLDVFDRGCKTTIKKPKYIQVKPPKTGAIVTTPIDCNNKFFREFKNTSTRADSIVWYFDTLNVTAVDASNINIATYTYPGRGTYPYKVVTFNDSTGCRDSIYKNSNITITIPEAHIQAVPPEACKPASIFFQNTSQDAYTTTYTFADGSSSGSLSGAANTSHPYFVNGTYIVTTTISDINQCTDVTTTSVEIYGPIASYTTNSIAGCVPLKVEFTDVSTLTYRAISWEWDFDNDGVFEVNSPSPIYTYTFVNTGTYNVRMRVTDEKGCNSLHSSIISPTFPKPNFAVSDTFICPGSSINFDAGTSQSYFGSYTWNFSDGEINSSNPQSTITHTFINEGDYFVKLTLTDRNGCSDTVSKKIQVRTPHPDFDIVRDATCGLVKAHFYDNTPDSEFTQSWFWDLDDGGYSVLEDPIRNYSTPGSYSVKLVVTNIAGCSDTIIQENIIKVPGPIGTYSYSPTEGCSPLKVYFKGESPNSLHYEWDFGDGYALKNTNSSGVDTVSHIYKDEIIATPYLYLLNEELIDGNIFVCKTLLDPMDSIVVKNYISVDAQPAYTILKEDSLLDVASFVTGYQNNTFYYSWSPAQYLSCNNCPNPVVTGIGDELPHTYQLTVKDERGCIGFDSITVEMLKCTGLDAILPNVITPNNDGINDFFVLKGWCKNDIFNLIIFNRWGNLVYEAEDIKAYWDGRDNEGEELPAGVYFYLLTYSETVTKGTIQILR